MKQSQLLLGIDGHQRMTIQLDLFFARVRLTFMGALNDRKKPQTNCQSAVRKTANSPHCHVVTSPNVISKAILFRARAACCSCSIRL
jgi:hypothetical protein